MPIGNSGYNFLNGLNSLYGIYGSFENDFSTMYPNNWLGVQNDARKCNFQFNVQNLENHARQLQVFTDALARQQQAAMTQQWQNMSNLTSSNMSALNGLGNFGLGGIDFTQLFNFGQPTLNNNNTQVRRTPERKLVEHLDRMAAGIMVADRINQTIEIPDGEGGTREVKIVDRLKELITDYQANPDDPIMSKKNYEKVWDVISRYDAHGDISSDDFATLKKIALNPLTDVDAADNDEVSDNNDTVDGDDNEDNNDNNDDNDNTTPQTQIRQLPNKYMSEYGKAESGIQNNYKMLANDFSQKLYNGDATEDDLNEITRNMNKYNVLNTVQEFYKEYGHMHDENLIDAIFADTSRWGSGSGLFGEGDWFSDDAKPSVTRLSNLLIERTRDMIKNNPNIDNETKEDLTNKIKALNDALNNVEVGGFFTGRGMWSGQDIKTENKKAISQAFQDLANTLQQYEIDTYGDPEEYEFTSSQSTGTTGTTTTTSSTTPANNPA